MAGASINTLMQNVQYRNSLPTATKPPLLDRYHYSGHGGDWQTGYAGSGYGHSSHSSGGGGSSHKKSNIALSALTLLAFLFFLNILQSCIQDHMHDMHHYNTTGVVVMTTGTARRRFRFKNRVGRSVTANQPYSSVLDNSELFASVQLFNSSATKLERFYDLLGRGLKAKYGFGNLSAVTMVDDDVDYDGFEDSVMIDGDGFIKGDLGEFTTKGGVMSESSIERNYVPVK